MGVYLYPHQLDSERHNQLVRVRNVKVGTRKRYFEEQPPTKLRPTANKAVGRFQWSRAMSRANSEFSFCMGNEKKHLHTINDAESKIDMDLTHHRHFTTVQSSYPQFVVHTVRSRNHHHHSRWRHTVVYYVDFWKIENSISSPSSRHNSSLGWCRGRPLRAESRSDEQLCKDMVSLPWQ